MKKIFTVLGTITVSIFALIGFSLTAIFLASFFHITDVEGGIDHARYFESKSTAQTGTSPKNVLGSVSSLNDEIQSLQDDELFKIQQLCHLMAINATAGDNADKIYRSYRQTRSMPLLEQMTHAADLHLIGNTSYSQALQSCQKQPLSGLESANSANGSTNIYPWVQDGENWSVLKEAITKDKGSIHKAASLAHIDERMLIAPLFVEQWRKYTSSRQLFKDVLKPMQILITSSKFSLGTMDIKEETAIQIEQNLKNSSSEYYLGPEYEHLLDFTTPDSHSERISRLTNLKDHYYSYLYGALYMRQLMKQWENAGFQIESRPEIVATLFNIGFKYSKPNPSPQVGGAILSVGGQKYTFGGLAYEFYYSGELTEDFPYREQSNQ